MDEVAGTQLEERLQNESACMQTQVRDCQFVFQSYFVAVEQKIQVDCAGPEPNGRFFLELLLDCLQLF